MLKWTPRAVEDLELIVDHISANFSVDLALMTINGLIQYVERTILANPLAGHLLESNPLFSKLVYEGNSIYYCENPLDRNYYIVYVQPRGTNFKKSRLKTDEVA
jgi:plasmid stabilization system protein ParE